MLPARALAAGFATNADRSNSRENAISAPDRNRSGRIDGTENPCVAGSIPALSTTVFPGVASVSTAPANGSCYLFCYLRPLPATPDSPCGSLRPIGGHSG